jgi:hypothetical protein
MAGELTIHSWSTAWPPFNGHSWIEYHQKGHEPTTYGTWGNNPGHLGNGLHRDIERKRLYPSHSTRSAYLDDEQEAKLFAKILEYEEMQQRAWRRLFPCSTFAADAWRAATGEELRHRRRFVFLSTPARLKRSIDAANAKG